MEKTMQDISPPNLRAWSGPPVPLCCLANRSPARQSSDQVQKAIDRALKERLRGLGSTIYQTVWKQHVTPSGRTMSRLRASAARTSAKEPSSELSGWITPGASDGSGGGQASRVGGPHSQQLNDQVMLTGWNMPRATDGSNGGPGQTGGALPADAALAGWLTATTRDWKDGGNPDVNVPLNALLGRTVWLAGWPTPVAKDDGKSPEAHLAMKQRMGERDGSGANRTQITSLQVMAQTVGPARLTASGKMLTGSSAGMESGGQLNPEHSRWLMGYPAAWGSCGATAMQSLRKPPKPSSKPASKPSTTFSVFD